MKRGSIYLCIFAAALLMAITFADFGFAQAQQAQTQEQAYQVFSIKVKSGMGMEWAAFLKNEVIPMMKKIGVKEFQTWNTAIGDPDECVMLLPLKNLSELDGPGPFASAGQYEAAALMGKLQRMVDSARFSIIEAQNDTTITPKTGYVPKIGVLATNTVAIGREEEFTKVSKAVTAAIGKTNAKGMLSSKMALGGNPNTYYGLVLFDSFADMEKFGPAFVKALMEAKLPPETGVVVQREYTILRYVPELSIQPIAP